MSPRRERLHDWAETAWDLLRLAALIALAVYLLHQIRLVVIPLMLGTFVASLGTPLAGRLISRGLPRLVATWLVVVLYAGLAVGVIWFVVAEIASAADEMATALDQARRQLEGWLASAPFGLDGLSLSGLIDRIFGSPTGGGGLLDRLLAGFSTATEAVTGLFLTLIVSFFVVKDGDRFWDWVLAKLPAERRGRIDAAGATAWATLRRYLGGTAGVGVVNGTAVAIGLLVLSVPLVIPLAILMFVGAFFPLVGAIVSGAVVVLTVLATNGVVDALIIAALVIVVQQLEGDLVAPILLGRAVALHPLLILFGITAGFVVGGIVGAFVTVPFVAVAAEVTRTLWPDLLRIRPEGTA